MVSAFAQEGDTVKVKRNKYMPTGVRLGTDVVALIRDTYDETFKGWELNGDVDFDRFYLAVDFGKWARTYTPDGNDYSNDGTYYRVGADVNFLTKDPDKNMFFIGARYGRSGFSETLITTKIDPVFGDISSVYTNDNLTGSWFELTTGLRVKMWRMIWLGYTARFKFGLNTNETGDMMPHDVPGFGRTDKESTWGFNYLILVRLPLPKKK